MNRYAMEPSSGADRMPQRVRHELRFRKLQVVSVERLTPSFVRVSLGGKDLDGFNSPGFDDHVKLILPDAATGQIHAPQFGPNGRPDWAGNARPVMRDYTPRYYDRKAGMLAIDFALHESGPATAWALRAKPGDWIGIGGPRGSFIVPTDFDWHLLVGDETALPAISRRVEELPATTRAIVVLEVGGFDDEIPLKSAAALEVHWCHRKGAHAGTTSVLLDALVGMSCPVGDGYAWVACESNAARALRAHLVQRWGMNSHRVKAAGYWRHGSADSHDRIED